MTPAAAFDRIAATYDDRWTNAPSGRLQRDVVWCVLETLLRPGMSALDLGCGTGEDAMRMMQLGAEIDAVDTSPEMVRRACEKGVNARVLDIEAVDTISGTYDIVLSNFGAMNCVADLKLVGRSMSRLICPGGVAVLCVLNKFCLWETAYYAARGEFRRSARRLWRIAHSNLGVNVYYHSVRSIRRALGSNFVLAGNLGVGVTIPPSYVPLRSSSWRAHSARIDQAIGGTALARMIADHRLLVFKRNS